ncbi:MAG: 30S ribosomal protein S16 [Candidatus Omnitrophica bacterium]|jgi:small subunit ribosomal protein S16|nr:30S ribosomal protein S16 [Candidatus Omnitrophota bacterium]
MAVNVRLRRIGKRPKNRAHFRIGVYDQRRGRDDRPIEEIGFYNPGSGQIKIDLERLGYWVKNGAQLSNTVASIFKKQSKAVKA